MKRGVLFFIGLVCLSIAIVDLLVWIIIATPEKSFDEAVNEYVKLFPKFIVNPLTLTLLDILLLLIAIGCFVYAKIKSNNKGFNIVSLILIILSGILACWNIFSLM